jgi:hypothetical protein
MNGFEISGNIWRNSDGVDVGLKQDNVYHTLDDCRLKRTIVDMYSFLLGPGQKKETGGQVFEKTRRPGRDGGEIVSVEFGTALGLITLIRYPTGYGGIPQAPDRAKIIIALPTVSSNTAQIFTTDNDLSYSSGTEIF